MMYVSITGLKLKNSWQLPRFLWHALRSMRQAKKAKGNLLVEARTIDGVHHTLSVWKDEADMRVFLISGAHLAAMKAFSAIATGKTVGYVADQPPSWDEVPMIWQSRGKVVANAA
jgi:hypothetical protein